MTDRDQLLGLIHRLYAAPGNLEAWKSFLDDLCAAIDGCGASFISHDLRSHRANVALTARTDPAALESYNTQWGAHDPWALSPRLRSVGSASVVVGDELVPHSEFVRTDYYAEFARPYDIVRCIAGMIETGPEVFSVISINRTERRGTFGAAESRLMCALMPHIHRALQLHRRVVSAERAWDGLASLIDRTAHGVLFVDRAGRVTYMNSAAERMSRARDGFVVEHRELRASRAIDTDRLRCLLAGAAATSAGESLSSGGVLAFGRPSGRRSLVIVVAPLPRHESTFVRSDAPVAVVTITDPDCGDTPDERTLQTLYGLTGAEASLARLLAEGVRLEDAGTRLGLRTATVRTRLKAIFEKTNTHRQPELVRLLLGSAPRF